RARPRLHPPRDRERLLEPERTDAPRSPPRPHTRRARRPDRPTHPRAHARNAAQHDQRPPRARSRRLRRPLNHIKPLAAHLFNSSNVLVSGSGIVALAGAAVVAQLLTGRTAPWIGAGGGSIALAAGMVLLVFAAARDSSAAYLAGSILGGAGFGAAFLGGLRALTAAIPHQHRAA